MVELIQTDNNNNKKNQNKNIKHTRSCSTNKNIRRFNLATKMIISLIPTLNYLIVICVFLVFLLLLLGVYTRAHPLFLSFYFESFSMNCTFQWKLSLFHNRFYSGFLCTAKTIGHHTNATHNNKFILECLRVFVCNARGHQENSGSFVSFVIFLGSIIRCVVYTHIKWTSNSLWVFNLFRFTYVFYCLLMHWTKKRHKATDWIHCTSCHCSGKFKLLFDLFPFV